MQLLEAYLQIILPLLAFGGAVVFMWALSELGLWILSCFDIIEEDNKTHW